MLPRFSINALLTRPNAIHSPRIVGHLEDTDHVQSTTPKPAATSADGSQHSQAPSDPKSTPKPMDIEQPETLIKYLRTQHRVGHEDVLSIEVLQGGVSNRTVLVKREKGDDWVIKQALAKLRVPTDWYSSLERVHREALGMKCLSELAPSGAITRLLFEDQDEHLLCMEAVPQPHVNWKSMLLGGDIRSEYISQFGNLLGTIHRRSTEQASEIRISLTTVPFSNHCGSNRITTERLASRAITLGDDLLCTNPDRIARAIESRSANALLLKVNQIGTLTEAVAAHRMAASANWHVTISARSGETEDNWLADLAVGWSANQIKVGSITQSERLSKYNRLLQIEAELIDDMTLLAAKLGWSPGFSRF